MSTNAAELFVMVVLSFHRDWMALSRGFGRYLHKTEGGRCVDQKQGRLLTKIRKMIGPTIDP